MKIYRMLVIVGIVLVQASGANAQFGGFGNLIKKGLNQPANPPPTADSNATPTNPPSTDSTTPPPNQPTSDQSQAPTAAAAANSANDSVTTSSPQNTTAPSVEKTDSSLPPIFQAIEQCDGVQFAELVKKDMSSVNKMVKIRKVYPDGQWENIRMTPLEYASQFGCTNIIQQLLDMDVDVNPSKKPFPISLAAGNGKLDAVKMLLKAKATPQDGVDEAVENGHADVLQTLINGGANLYAAGEGVGIDFSLLVKNGYAEVVQVVLKELAKGDPQKKYQESDNFTSGLHAAERQGKLDIVKIFVADGAKVEKPDFQLAIAANNSDMLAYLKETKNAQDAAAADQAAAAEKEQADKEAAQKADFIKKSTDALDHPADLFGMANSRYRKFNGTVYDCAEPIEFLNRFYAVLPIETLYNERPSSFTELKGRIEAEDKWLRENPWYKIAADCTLSPVQVKQVTPDGLIVRLNSQEDVELLVLLKNHPKQKTAVDGDVIIGQLFALKTSPYQYTDVLGVARTIPSYDMGVVVPTPSGSVPKLPVPATGH